MACLRTPGRPHVGLCPIFLVLTYFHAASYQIQATPLLFVMTNKLSTLYRFIDSRVNSASSPVSDFNSQANAPSLHCVVTPSTVYRLINTAWLTQWKTDQYQTDSTGAATEENRTREETAIRTGIYTGGPNKKRRLIFFTKVFRNKKKYLCNNE